MQPTIKSLRQQGYKVRVIHERYHDTIKTISGSDHYLSARGGTTTIQITTPDKKLNAEGVSICSSQDNFNKKVGNSIALGRALKDLRDTKQLAFNFIG